MSGKMVHRLLIIVGIVLIVSIAPGMAVRPARAGLISRGTDPAQVVPLDRIAPERRDIVAEVIRDHTFHRQGEADTFPCPSSLYLGLVNEPAVTLALWKDLSDAPVKLSKLGPNRYTGSDGSGATATWEFVLRTPQTHVLLGYLTYVTPRGNAQIDARIVLIVNASYYQDNQHASWIQHSINAFVKVDSRGWKALARTARPVAERVLEEQVKEAGYFISLMARLVVTYPNWATQVINAQPAIDPNVKERFCQVIAQSKAPGASAGRPVLARQENSGADARQR